MEWWINTRRPTETPQNKYFLIDVVEKTLSPLSVPGCPSWQAARLSSRDIPCAPAEERRTVWRTLQWDKQRSSPDPQSSARSWAPQPVRRNQTCFIINNIIYLIHKDRSEHRPTALWLWGGTCNNNLSLWPPLTPNTSACSFCNQTFDECRN